MFGNLFSDVPLYLEVDAGGSGASSAAEPAATDGDAASGDASSVADAVAQKPLTEQIRETILKAHPNVIEELVTGDSWQEMLASVPIAEAAYERVAAQLAGAGTNANGDDQAARAASIAQEQPPKVPAGDSGTSTVNIDALSPESKIALGVRQQNSRS